MIRLAIEKRQQGIENPMTREIYAQILEVSFLKNERSIKLSLFMIAENMQIFEGSSSHRWISNISICI